MDITIEHLGVRIRDGLAWYAEKLIPSALGIHRVKSVLVEFLDLKNEDLAAVLPAYSCRVQVCLADGRRIAAESADTSGVSAIYDAVDKLKSALSRSAESNCVK